jgi:hypothetical protein
MGAALYPATRAMGARAPTAPQLSCRPFAPKTGSTDVLSKPARKGNCCPAGAFEQEISSYFPWLIAIAQNKLLFKGSSRPCGSLKAVSDLPQEQNHLLAHVSPEDWLVAFATALAAFVLLGVLPRLFW